MHKTTLQHIPVDSKSTRQIPVTSALKRRYERVTRERLRILHVVPSLDPVRGAGLGASALALHKQMLREGMQSTLYTAECPPNIPVANVISPRSTPRNPFFYNPGTDSTLRKLIAHTDVVHQHGLYTHLNWCSGSACLRTRKTLVYHPQGTLALWYLKRKSFTKNIVLKLYENRNFSRVDLWRAVTKAEVKEIRRFAPTAQVAVVPNGLDFQDYTHRRRRRGNMVENVSVFRRRNLLFMARISHVKGVDLLLEAWNQLEDLHDSWQLLIAGSETEGFGRKLRRRFARFQESGSVRWLGHIEGKRKMEILSNADFFVLPSRAEGFSLAVLEALGSGVPVIVTTACNFDDVAEKGVGFVAQVDVSSLVAQIRAATSLHPTITEKMSDAAKSLVAEEYSWPHISSLLANAVEETRVQ